MPKAPASIASSTCGHHRGQLGVVRGAVVGAQDGRADRAVAHEEGDVGAQRLPLDRVEVARERRPGGVGSRVEVRLEQRRGPVA